MTVIERIKGFIGPSKDDLEIRRMIENSSYKTIRVKGRGTLSVDPQEVLEIPGFKEEVEKLSLLVEHSHQK